MILFLFSGMMLFSQSKSTVIQKINGSDFYIHKIEKGQSLYSISKLYDVSLDEIYNQNPEAKTGTKSGQEIKIPVKNKAQTVNTPTVQAKTNTITSTGQSPIDTNQYIVYKVGAKETLYAITKKLNITEAELKLYNPSLLTQGLKEGQQLIVGEKKKSPANHVSTATLSSSVKDSISNRVINIPKKQAYKLALILPFRFEESVNLDIPLMVKNKTNFPAIPALALDFYLGFKRAVDSLSAGDFSVNIDLYDIDDKDSIKLAQTVKDPKFKQTDLIFGPLHAYGFKPMAQMAKDLGIPIVSPVTQQNKILFNNVYVSKTNPSQFTLLESLADYCIDSLIRSNENIILAMPSVKDPKEDNFAKAFKKYYNDRQKALGKTAKDTITVVKGLEGVKRVYKQDVKNVIVILSTNQVFLSDFTTQLAVYAAKKDVVLCGWQSVTALDNIDQEYLNQLHYTFPCQYNLTNTSAYAGVIESYRSLQSSYPGEYFFIGFDIAHYYLKLLKEQGPGFVIQLDKFPQETNYTRFNFVRPDANTGFDNRGTFIFTYQDYSLRKTGWK
ncbi:MAG TPA: LysM peptidoglycan-binding domain-containing protein [Bacteroidia bacterium]|nr:LysM peptidoglycan-binding domain-containing protein [Bacteroidia bacterium]